MPLKKFNDFQPHESCSFCKLRITGVLYGPIYKCRAQYEKKNYIIVHYYCLLMASKIEQNGRDNQGILGFFPKDIIKELKRGCTQTCSFCNRPGATVHCIHKDCDKIFHLPCGIEKGSIHQFYNLFDSYCHLHRPKQNIPANIFKHVKDSCVICCINVDKRNKYDCLWPSCCKPKVLFHRKCIQTMACNAGYFFKCPLCNNSDIFKKEMQRIGIYVPEQDASWELEPNAYEELETRGSGCESKNCVCPKGRTYSQKSSPWQLELCKVCGGNGVHLGCNSRWNRLSGFKFNWFCEICKPVFLKNKSSRTPEHVSVTDEDKLGVNSEDTNDSSQSTSLNIEQSDNSQQRTQLHPNNKKMQYTPSVSESAHAVTARESDDEVVIVVSEDEEEPPKSPKKMVIEEPNNVKNPKTDKACNTPHHDSDDDLHIVGVVANKRSMNDFLPNRKRLRTAPWAPPPDERRELKCESNESVNTSQFSISPMSTGYSQMVSPSPEGHGFKDRQPSSSTCANVFRTIHSPKGSLNDSVNLQSDSQINLIKSEKEFSLPSKTQLNSLAKHKDDINLPSDIGLKLSEVSINRIVPKNPLSDPNNQVIDLSSDEESVDQPSKDVSEKAVNTFTVTPRNSNLNDRSELKKILSSGPAFTNGPNMTIAEQLEAWIRCPIVSNLNIPPNKPVELINIKEQEYIKRDSSYLKNLNSSVTLQVVLSSDDEEESRISSLQTSSDSAKSNNSGNVLAVNNRTIDTNRNFVQNQTVVSKCNDLQLQLLQSSSELGNSTSNDSFKRKELNDPMAVKYIPAKRIKSKNLCLPSTSQNRNSIKLVPETSSPVLSESILHNVLSSISKFQSSGLTVKPDVLILSDDDEEKVEAVHHSGNTFTSDNNMSESGVEKPLPANIFISDQISHQEDTEPPESSGYKVSESITYAPSAPSGNECIGVISQVMTLTEPIQFDDEDVFPQYEVETNEDSTVLKIESNPCTHKGDVLLTELNSETIAPLETSAMNNMIVCNDQLIGSSLLRSPSLSLEQSGNTKTFRSQEYLTEKSSQTFTSVNNYKCNNVNCTRELDSRVGHKNKCLFAGGISRQC